MSEIQLPAPNDISPKVWILVLPIVFLTCVTQLANLSGPDFSTFADVFSIWLLTGMAALIILLAFRVGGGKRSTMTERRPPPVFIRDPGESVGASIFSFLCKATSRLD